MHLASFSFLLEDTWRSSTLTRAEMIRMDPWAVRLSKKSEYALRAMVALARRHGGPLAQIQELSSRENIPVKFLEQILLTLRHGGLVLSRRGVAGGYSLARHPSEISVHDIVELLDGPVTPVPCTSGQSGEVCSCPDTATCVVRLGMVRLKESLDRWMKSLSLADLLRLAPPEREIEFII